MKKFGKVKLTASGARLSHVKFHEVHKVNPETIELLCPACGKIHGIPSRWMIPYGRKENIILLCETTNEILMPIHAKLRTITENTITINSKEWKDGTIYLQRYDFIYGKTDINITLEAMLSHGHPGSFTWSEELWGCVGTYYLYDINKSEHTAVEMVLYASGMIEFVNPYEVTGPIEERARLS